MTADPVDEIGQHLLLFGLLVQLVEAPLECVVLGAGHCLENWDVLSDMFMDARV